LPNHLCINLRSGAARPYRWEFEKDGEALAVDLSRPLIVDVIRRAHDGEPVIARHAHGHHIALDPFAEVNTSVEARGDELCASLLRRSDVGDDVGKPTRQMAPAWLRAPSWPTAAEQVEVDNVEPQGAQALVVVVPGANAVRGRAVRTEGAEWYSAHFLDVTD